MAVTAERVATWGQLGTVTGDDLTLLNDVIAAVTAYVNRRYVLSTPPTDEQELAIIMQVAALWARRHSPGGVAGFGEYGPVRISRIDPDIERLLVPRWGIA